MKLYVIGDSISIHYGPYLKAYLSGIMEYSRKEGREEALFNLDNPQGDSGGDSSMVLSFLKAKARCGGLDADFLLLNCGLHDIKTDPVSGNKQVPISQYENNLREIVKIVRETGPKLIWIRTTLFDDATHNSYGVGFHRYVAECIEYNRVADRVMEEEGVPVIDLCMFTINLGCNLYCDHVHFTEAVREKQAAFIANWLKEHLCLTDRFESQNAFNSRISDKSLSVSVVLCCYNSAAKLPETLKHLAEQNVADEISWEVILVNNASTDNTAKVARSLWPSDAPVPLRIVSEPRPGLIYARIKGIYEARHELICFVDDDNWLAPNWVKTVSQIMAVHPEVGACGGRTEAVFEKEPLDWFEDYAENFVVGRQGEIVGDITWERGNLWGAGLTIRKKAWANLIENGFQPTLSGRRGSKLSSGEDYELCYALRLAGWRLWYTDELVLKHFMPANRITVEYLYRLKFELGAQTVGFDPYDFYVRYMPSEIKPIFGKIWLRQLLREVYISLFRDFSFWKKWAGNYRNTFNHHMRWLNHKGRINALWNVRDKYDHQINSFGQNRWICIEKSSANFLCRNPAFGDSANLNLSRNPLVTVLICNYNYGRYLGEAVESVLAQTWENLEIIVVDDGSTDESREILKKYEGKIRIILKENGGQASAFNVGVAKARGDILCFLDSDDIWFKNRISRVVDKYKQAPWGLVCHDLKLIDGDGRSLNKNWSQYAGVNMVEGSPADVVLKNNYSWVFSPTSGMSIPKKLADKVFPISCDIWKISADEPLAFSAACLNFTGIISEALGYYRLHGNNLFAPFHDDKVARRIAGLTHTTRRYFFCNQFASICHSELTHPKSNYRYYRLCCLIARNKPYRYILNLLSKNINYNLQSKRNAYIKTFNIAVYFASDIVIILSRIFNKSSKHNFVKKRFEKESLHIDEDQLRYMLYD